MKKNKLAILCIGFATAFFAIFAFGTTCNAAEAAKPTPVYEAKETDAFKALAKETITALDAGKNTEMIAKLTDLETAWDAKEETLKPKNPATWKLLDKTLDKAISALRSSKTDLPKGKAALEDLIKKLEETTKS